MAGAVSIAHLVIPVYPPQYLIVFPGNRHHQIFKSCSPGLVKPLLGKYFTFRIGIIPVHNQVIRILLRAMADNFIGNAIHITDDLVPLSLLQQLPFHRIPTILFEISNPFQDLLHARVPLHFTEFRQLPIFLHCLGNTLCQQKYALLMLT